MAATIAGCLVGVAALEPEVAVADEASCWESHADSIYTFEVCCRMSTEGVNGDSRCWAGPFTYERCCLPEMEPALQRGWRLLEDGDCRAAADTLVDLAENFFATHAAHADLRALAFQGVEKAYHGLLRQLEDLPRGLDYRELIYNGLGRECEPVGGAESAWDAFHRCCDEPFPQTVACMTVFEMMMRAVGHKARIRMGEDGYYGDMSESWAFRHFTPSVLLPDGVSEADMLTAYDEAFRAEPDMANALAEDGDSRLGVVFSKSFPSYRSPQYFSGVTHLTLALAAVRNTVSGPRPVHIFEVGAGYGALPRLLGSSRERLLALERPVDIQSYAVFDVRSVIDLQRWYLGRSFGSPVQLRTWPLPSRPASESTSAGPWGLRGEAEGDLWAHHRTGSPLVVDLVDLEHRDLFAHLYSAGQLSSSQRDPADGELPPRPSRVLFAVNSWHEMPQAEWMWYYKEFVSGPSCRLAADWILYVANQEWDASASKQALLLQGGPGYRFELELERCRGTRPGESLSCLRLLRRAV